MPSPTIKPIDRIDLIDSKLDISDDFNELNISCDIYRRQMDIAAGNPTKLIKNSYYSPRGSFIVREQLDFRAFGILPEVDDESLKFVW